MNGAPLPPARILDAIKGFASGVAKKKIRTSTVKAALAALKNAVEISNHYKQFPETEEGFSPWCAKADALYEKIGKIKSFV